MTAGVPIHPSEVATAKMTSLPAFVIDAINSLIAEKACGMGRKITATVRQKDIEDRIVAAVGAMHEGRRTVDVIYDSGWMDFELAYEAVGWKVSYDRPAYNESYDATFEFRAMDA